jgi:plastocyanin
MAGGALLAAGVAAVAVIPAASGSTAHVTQAAKKPVKRKVKVRDYYLSPTKLKVPPKSTITWVWPSLENEGESHNVSLRKHPKGVKPWTSEIASSDYKFKRKLRKKGKYVVICTLHPYDMRMTIRVK